MRTSISLKSRPYLVIFIITIVLSSPLLINSCLHTRSDAVIHIGITNVILRSGIPPQNPFLAGEKLHYYWFYNALVATLTKLIRLKPATIMAILNPIGLFILLIMVYHIIILISHRHERNNNGLLGVFLVAFGLNGWGWLLLIRRISQNGISSLSPILTNGVWGFLPHIVLIKWEGTMGFVATKFLVANSFSLSLATLSVAIYVLFKFFQQPKIKFALMFLGATILSAYLNLIAAGGFIIICTFFFILWFSLSFWSANYNRRIALYGLAVVLLTLAIITPYLASVLDSSFALDRSLFFKLPDLFKLRVLVVILFPLWILAGITFKASGNNRDPAARIFLIVSIIMLSAGFLFLRFLKQNEFKLPFLLTIFLSVLIGSNVALLRPKTARIVWLITLTTIPTSLLGLIAYSHEPLQIRTSAEEDAVYTWIKNNVSKNAVVISEQKNNFIPMLAQRNAYLACYSFLESIPGNRDLIRRRKRVLWKLWHGENKAESLKAISNELMRPIVLMTYSSNMILPEEITPLHSNKEICLWSLPYPYPGKKKLE